MSDHDEYNLEDFDANVGYYHGAASAAPHTNHPGFVVAAQARATLYAQPHNMSHYHELSKEPPPPGQPVTISSGPLWSPTGPTMPDNLLTFANLPSPPPKIYATGAGSSLSGSVSGDDDVLEVVGEPVDLEKMSKCDRVQMRREKKREADRRCRKKKKEKVSDMESTMKRLWDDRKQLKAKILQLEQKERDWAERPVTPTASETYCDHAKAVAESTATLFNKINIEIAGFVRDNTCPDPLVFSPSGDTTDRDSMVKLFISLKTQFPNSVLTIASTDFEVGGRYDVAFTIKGSLSDGRALCMTGHFFVSMEGLKVTKLVGLWNENSLRAVRDGIERVTADGGEDQLLGFWERGSVTELF